MEAVEGFDEALDLHIRTGRPREQEFDGELDAGIGGTQLDDKFLFAVHPYDTRDGALLLETLPMKISQNAVDKIAVLHELFFSEEQVE